MTSREMQAAAGVTARQLQYWAETRVLPVKVIGHKRVYEAADVRKAEMLKAIAKAGLPVRYGRLALKQMDRFDRAVRVDRPMIIDRVLCVPTWSARKYKAVKETKSA